MVSTLRCLKVYNHTLWWQLCLLLYILVSVTAIVTDESRALWNKTGNDDYNEYKDEHFVNGHSVIVYLFEWKFVDVAKECTEFLGPKGFAGVQLSPVTEHILLQTEVNKRPWWERYLPISYQIETRAGNEQQLSDMLQACNKAGVRVYIDVVLNHMAGLMDENDGAEVIGSAGNTANISLLDFAAVPYSSEHFHKPCAVINYFDAHEVRNCQLNGFPDLDHSKHMVQTEIITFLNKLIDMGVAGFRINAAKYMWPIDLKAIYNSLNDLNSEKYDFEQNARPLIMQDIWDMGADSVSKTEYAGYGLVTEYLYILELTYILTGRSPLVTLQNWGPALGFLPSSDAVVWVDFRAEFLNEYEMTDLRHLSYKHPAKYIMANAFMLSHAYGHIRVLMSTYAYEDENIYVGPPRMLAEDNETNVSELEVRSPEFNDNEQCIAESGWICEHRWPAIVRMVSLANCLCNEKDVVNNFQTDGPNHISFCRGEKAFIAINNDRELTYEAELHTCLPMGIYCDVISGGRNENGDACLGKIISVNEESNAQISLPPIKDEELADAEDIGAQDIELGVIAIYLGSKLA